MLRFSVFPASDGDGVREIPRWYMRATSQGRFLGRVPFWTPTIDGDFQGESAGVHAYRLHRN